MLASTSALVLLLPLTSSPASARGLDQYIKRRPPLPLEDCIPPALAARDQLARAGERAANNDLDGARELLRSGPFYRLRDSLRGIAERTNTPGLASAFLAELEVYDGKLVEAQKLLKAEAGEEELRVAKAAAAGQLAKALAALDVLLATVPEDLRTRAEALLSAASAAPAEAQDDEMLLRSLVDSRPPQ